MSFEIRNTAWKERFDFTVKEIYTQTGVEAGMEQATSWANAAFLKIKRCVSISFKAWSMNANFLAWLFGTPCLVTSAKWVTANTRAATLASNSLASNGGYRLRTTSSTRGGIRRATWGRIKCNNLSKNNTEKKHNKYTYIYYFQWNSVTVDSSSNSGETGCKSMARSKHCYARWS